MANTTPDGIYYPEGATLVNLDAILATMASSIANGIGKRLALQEIAVGLKASLAAPVTLTSEATAPVVVTSINGDFAQGLTITNGIVTVATPGMYLISGGLGITNIGGHTARLSLKKNTAVVASDEQMSSATFFQVAKCTTVVNCKAGDTLSMGIGDAAGGAMTAAYAPLTHLSIAMVQAVPVA